MEAKNLPSQFGDHHEAENRSFSMSQGGVDPVTRAPVLGLNLLRHPIAQSHLSWLHITWMRRNIAIAFSMMVDGEMKAPWPRRRKPQKTYHAASMGRGFSLTRPRAKTTKQTNIETFSYFCQKRILPRFSRSKTAFSCCFGLPIVQILLFGFCADEWASRDSKLWVDYANDPASKEIIQKACCQLISFVW